MWLSALIVGTFAIAVHGFLNLADVPCGVSPSNQTGSPNATHPAAISPRLTAWQRLAARFLPSFFVVGGNDAKRDQIPFIASLSYHRRHFCGASLIHKRFVLTAAHCYDPRFEPIWNIEASVGDYDLSLDDGQEYIPVSDYIMHESFDPRVDMVHDIALYKLQFDVTWGPTVQPVCLPDVGYRLTGRTVTASGWGTTSYGGSSSDILQTVELPVVSNSVCRQLPKLILLTKGAVTPYQLCAGLVGFQDTCQGDSGGPLVDVEDKSNRRILAGLTSYGFMCAVPFAPGIYTRVSAYVGWIKAQVTIYSSIKASTRRTTRRFLTISTSTERVADELEFNTGSSSSRYHLLNTRRHRNKSNKIK